MATAFHADMQDVKNFVIASVVLGAAFASFYHEYTVNAAIYYLGLGALVLLVREAGMRLIAQWMESYSDLSVSRQGAITTLFGAILAVLTGWPVLLLFPVYSNMSSKKYEQWGKSTDSVWMKRQFWFHLAAVVSLLIGWAVFYSYSLMGVAQAFALFAFFQAMPLDYSLIPSGDLDGAYILRWSGFIWLLTMGTSIIAVVLSFA
ncbi:MAG: hypothetical protein ABEJ75_00915 [Candidatus Nanohaloarchaea archaeon]